MSRFITNLQAMKNCAELGIEMTANIITEHPLSTEAEIDETIRNIEVARCYPPPDSFSPFTLQVGSPDHLTGARGSYKLIGNNVCYKRVYPPWLFDSLDLPSKEFITTEPAANWERLITPHMKWKSDYAAITREIGENTPHLAYFDGGTFLRIEDYRTGELEIYLLDQLERDICLFTNQIKTWTAIFRRFSNTPEDVLRQTLDELLKLNLIYEEDDAYLRRVSDRLCK